MCGLFNIFLGVWYSSSLSFLAGEPLMREPDDLEGDIILAAIFSCNLKKDVRLIREPNFLMQQLNFLMIWIYRINFS